MRPLPQHKVSCPSTGNTFTGAVILPRFDPVSVTTSKHGTSWLFTIETRGVRYADATYGTGAGQREGDVLEKARAIRGGRRTRAQKEALEKAGAHSWAASK